jgi:hypothetical protein
VAHNKRGAALAAPLFLKASTVSMFCFGEGLIQSPNIPSAAKAALQANHLRHPFDYAQDRL